MAVTTSNGQEGDTRRLVALWAAFLTGPVAWTFNQGAGYALMKPVCAGKATPLLWLVAAASLLLVAAGSWTAWHWIRQLRGSARDEGSGAVDRSYFMAVLALAFNALIGLLIVTSVIPQLLLSPCE
jgi:hypothetical protein